MSQQGACYSRSHDVTAYWRAGRLCLACGRTNAEYAIDPALLRLLDALNPPRSLSEIARLGIVPSDKLDHVLAGLLAGGFIQASEHKNGSEGAAELLSPLEMGMHAQASRGPIGRPRGSPPPSRMRTDAQLAHVRLPEPDAVTPLSPILARRRSVREYGAELLTVTQVSHFLWESARVRGVIGAGRNETTHRASPSAGARHSLEMFLLARDIVGLGSGVYHYDPYDHSLSQVDTYTQAICDLQSRLICSPMRISEPPAISIYLTSLPERVTWKYEAMALSAIYRDTGCLMQTMYLVATDLGLAPCSVAAIDNPVSIPYIKDRYPSAMHVGSFALGSLPET